MADEYIRLDTTIIAIDNLINEAATGTIARTLFKAKDTIYNQQRYAINGQPVKHSRWIPMNDGTYNAFCDNCGYERGSKAWNKADYKYCPYCGARMDGDTE